MVAGSSTGSATWWQTSTSSTSPARAAPARRRRLDIKPTHLLHGCSVKPTHRYMGAPSSLRTDTGVLRQAYAPMNVEELCGQLLVGGFEGTTLPESFAEALARGHRAGAILFRRNLASLSQVAALTRSILAALPN